VDTDPQLLAVHPDNFAEHLQVIKRVATPLSLTNLTDSIRSKHIPRRGVVITLDDGAADNLHVAKPLLEKYEIPATVFVATGYAAKEFWWDELERLLLLPGQTPEKLRLTVDQKTFEWDLSNAANYTEADFEKYKSWHVLAETNVGVRQQLYAELCDTFRSLAPAARLSLMEQLRSWTKAYSTHSQKNVGLRADEVKELGTNPLIDIGAHTVNHPVLSSIPLSEQRKEILESKTCLEQILSRPITTFAYPYGTRRDYTSATVNLVKELGFHSACSNFTGVVQSGAHLFELPRFVVRNWNADEFQRQLEGWFFSD